MPNSEEALGERVRRLRADRGLSQSDLARPGLSGSYVSLIEAGKREPTAKAVVELADALGCTVDEIRNGSRDDAAEAHGLRLNWAELALNNGSPEEALTGLRALLSEARVEPRTRWRARYLLAQAHESTNNLEDAIAELDGLRIDAEAEPSRWPWLEVIVALCRCYREAGDLQHSISLAKTALSRVDELGLSGTDEHAEVASTLVASYYERGDLTHAALLAKKLIDSTKSATPRAQAAAYWNASVVAQERGQVGQALVLADKAIVRLAQTGTARNVARLRLVYAALLLRLEPSEPQAALAILEEVTPRLSDVGSQVDLAYAQTETARALVQLGQPDRAVGIAQQAVDRLGSQPRLETARALTVLGQALRALGDFDTAAVRLRHAGQLLDLIQPGRNAASAWHEVADVMISVGQQDEAIRAYQRSLASMGIQPGQVVRTATAE